MIDTTEARRLVDYIQTYPPERPWEGNEMDLARHLSEALDEIKRLTAEQEATWNSAIEMAAKYHDNFMITKTNVDVELVVSSTEAIRALCKWTTITDAPKLLPCPFCGDPMTNSKDLVRHVYPGACPIGLMAWGASDAVVNWNTRAEGRNARLRANNGD